MAPTAARRGCRPGADSADLASGRRHRAGSPRVPIHRAARHGQDQYGRILAKAVNCLDPQDGEPDNSCPICQAVEEGRALDLIEIDAASNRGIDDIRSLREKINFAPNEARYKVYIVDEVHMLTDPAFNALLKTLEEPPGHAIFVLATTEPHKVPLTIVSRCQRFDFRRVPIDSAIGRLSELCQAEGVVADENALLTIARNSGGSLRDAVNMLEQVIVSYGEEITEANVRDLLELGGDEEALELVDHIINRRPAEAMGVIGRFVGGGADLRQLHRATTEFLRGVLLAKTENLANVGYSIEVADQLKSLADQTTMGHLLDALKTFTTVDLRRDSLSPLPLELAVIESTIEPDATVTQVERSTNVQPTAQVQPSGQRATSRPAPTPRYQPSGRPETAQPVRETPAPRTEPATRPPARSDAPGSGSSPTLEEGWNSLLHSLRRHKGKRYNLGALLRACTQREVSGDKVVLMFTHRSHMERMQEELDDPPTRRVVGEALANLMGEEYDVKLSVIGEDTTNGTQSAAERSHLVRAAQQMGATIVEEREEAVEQEHVAAGPATSEADDEAARGT